MSSWASSSESVSFLQLLELIDSSTITYGPLSLQWNITMSIQSPHYSVYTLTKRTWRGQRGHNMIQSVLTKTPTIETPIFLLGASSNPPDVHLRVPSQCLKPTYVLYEGDGRGLRGHWVYLIIDCQIKGCSSLESSLTPTSICLHLEGPAHPPPPRPLPRAIHFSTTSSLTPLPLSSTPNYPSIYLSIGPDHLSLSLSPSSALSHQHHFSWRANSCLTVMALKAEQGASRCVRACVSLHVCL